MVSKGTHHFKYVSKEQTKQTKASKGGLDKEKSNLSNKTIKKYTFCFLVWLIAKQTKIYSQFFCFNHNTRGV